MIRLHRLRYKLTVGATLLSMLVGLGSATTVQVTTMSTTETVSPGQTAVIANYTVAGRNTTATIESTAVTLPFETTVTPANGSVAASCSGNKTSCPWVNRTGTVAVTVPMQEDPETYTGELRVQFADRPPATAPVTVTIPEQRNWSLANTSFPATVSVGSKGDYGTVNVTNTGNVDAALVVNLTGNLSEYVSVQPTHTVYPGFTETIRLRYQIREDVPFGRYGGTLQLHDRANRTQAVNLSTTFEDTIPPALHLVAFPDEIMATLDAEWEVIAQDNLQVDAVTANVTRETTETVGNTTRLVNTSVTSLAFDAVENTDRWTAAFTETADRGRYYARFTVQDTAGNTVTRTTPFTVTSLDALSVLETNFEFDSDRPSEPLTRQIFTLDTETPVDVTLESFRELETNASMVVGLRHTDAESADTFDGPGDSITVTEPGTYTLVVEAEEKGRFRGGKLSYGVIDEHVNISDVTTEFSGQFIDPECPSEQSYRTGRFNGSFGYTDGGCVDGRIELVLSGPAEICHGFAEPDQCINGYDLGELDRLKQQVNTSEREKTAAQRSSSRAWLVGGSGFTVFIVLSLVLYLSRRAEGTMATRYAPKKSEIDIYQGDATNG